MDDTVAPADISSLLQSPRTPERGTNSFAEKVAVYFGSYVDGALSSNGKPLRAYGDSYTSGLLRKLPLERYPQLSKNIYKNFITGLGQQTFVITQNKYIGQQDEYTVHILRTNTLGITQKKLAPLLQTLVFEAESSRLSTYSNQNDAVEALLSATRRALVRDFVVPYVLPLDLVSDSSDDKTKQSVAALCEAASSRIYDASKETLRQVYIAYLSSTEPITGDALTATLEDTFTPQAIKDSLAQFIEHTQINDAYHHTYTLHRGTSIDTNKSIYVYFGELSYDSQTYPLFYTKVASEHIFPSVTLTFENRVFINKQAIEYVIRQFANRTNKYIDVQSLGIPSVLYAGNQTEVLQRVVSAISAALDLPDDLKIEKAATQELANHFVTVSNKLSLHVGASYESSISDDYTTILTDSQARSKVGKYLNNLLIKPNNRYVEQVRETWDDLSDFDKLLPVAPIPINDEQKQILMALDNPAGERLVVDAPNETGKGHLIRSAVLTSLAKGKTALVVGTSAETSAKLQQDIGAILHQTSGNKGHNPVFNVHDTETIEKIDDQVIAKISASTQLVGEKLTDLASAKKRKKQTLKDSLKQFTQSAENINLHEVEMSLHNDKRFAGKTWIDDEPIDEISTLFQKFHRAIQYVRTSEASYLMPYVDLNKQQAMDEFLATYVEYEKANRSVRSRLPDFIVRYKKLLPEQRTHLKESLAYIQSNYRQYVKILKDTPASSWLAINDDCSFEDISDHENRFDTLLDITQGAAKQFKYGDQTKLLRELDSYSATPMEIIDALDTYVEQIATLKSKIFGFSGRMLVVENLNKQLIKSLPSFSLSAPEKQTENMQVMSNFVKYVIHQLAAAGIKPDNWKNVVRIMLTDDASIEETQQILSKLNQLSRYDFTKGFAIHEADNLLANITLLDYATDLNRIYRDFPKIGKLFGITTITHLLARPHELTARAAKLTRDLHEASQLSEAKETIKSFSEQYPDTAKRLGVVFTNNNFDIIDDTFANSDSEFIKEYIAHKKKEQDIRLYFDEVTVDSFANESVEYQQILGVELQHTLNSGLVQSLRQPAQFSALGQSIKERRRLTSDETARLLAVFPCVTAEVHQLSSTLPLDIGLFDLVIIDSADSLTIAETFPAVLRGKKVLIVGDSKQTGKPAGQLNDGINNLHKHQLEEALRSELSQDSADEKNTIVAKQSDTFEADSSALNFFTAFAQFDATFSKQYGTYDELASFGNKYYYDNATVSLMSRATPRAELFTFSKVKPSTSQATRFTNAAEVEAIIEHLHTLKEQGFSGSIGIVTPFAEQAALIQKELDECVITDWFEHRDLKVMTFDTKRNVTRDYTYYSLVASSSFNEISQQLPSRIGFDAFKGDDRAQRLLTGFSGTRRAAHIVHSLDFDAYGGALSETLRHFVLKVQGPTVKVKGGSTDVFSPTEININQAFDKTMFAKKYKERMSFIAKYPFVHYIRPLSPHFYKAPYKVFFLVMVDDRPIVIEFDDFKERFLQTGKNGKDNIGTYMTAQDVYGYKLLEGYGYRFLRLNKFSAGIDPAQTLDKHLAQLIKEPSWASDNGFVA